MVFGPTIMHAGKHAVEHAIKHAVAYVAYHAIQRGPPLHTGAPDSGRARKVLQLNKQGAPRGPWGRWAG